MPLWPFKKKEVVAIEEVPRTQVYEKGTENTAEVLADTSHKESTNYKDAMALFGGKKTEEQIEWLHHTDGYWYKKKSDGSYDSNPHVLDSSGNIVPFNVQDQ